MTQRKRGGRPSTVVGAVLVAALMALAACGGSSDEGGLGTQTGSPPPAVLRVGLVPNVAPETQRAKYEPFGKYLEQKLGVKVELFVSTNYTGTVAALEGGKLDLAYLGGLTYVQTRQRMDVSPLVTEIDIETGTERYKSAIITKRGSGVEKLTDLVGRDFAFGDPSSTSGSLYPRVMLVDAGFDCSTTTVDKCPPLRKVLYTGGHDAAVGAVANDQVAGAGVEARILNRLIKDGKVDGAQIRVLAEHDVMGYPWVVPASLNAEFRQRLADTFTSITDPTVLDLLRAKGYKAVSSEDYDEVERHARRLGLLASG